jgi:hypothetical protein
VQRRRSDARGPARPASRPPATPPRPAAERRGEAPSPPLDRGGAERGALALATGVGALTALRAAFTFVPSMWGWSLNLMRFLHPLAAWPLWLLPALALVPSIGRRLEPLAARIGTSIVRHRWAALVWIGLIAIVVALFPDRVRYVGDFLLRQGAVEEAVEPGRIFPQSLPLDPILHYTIPLFAVRNLGLGDPNAVGRAIGALEAALLATVALGFARTLGFAGVAALASAAIILGGGHLTLFTGYSKAFAELCVLTGAVAVLGLRVIRTGTGFLPLGIVLAIAFALHRSAIALLPVAAVAWLLGFRALPRERRWKNPWAYAGVAIPLLSLGFVAPRVIRIITRFDWESHLRPTRATASVGSALHFADLANLLVMLSPILLPALAALPFVFRELARRREALLLVALTLPFAVMLVTVHPQNGVYRDWDVHAAGGVAFSVLAAWVVGETLRSAPARAWIGPAVALAAFVPSVQWLVHHADLESGLARVEAFVTEPPLRSEADRAASWDFLGIRNYRLERWREAERGFAKAAELTPSPRILMEWGIGATRAGNLEAAEEAYRRLAAGSPGEVAAWRDLARSAARRGNLPEAWRATREILKLEPANSWAHGMTLYLQEQDSIRAAQQRP